MGSRAHQAYRTEGRVLNHVAALYDPLIEKLSFGREQRFRELTLELMAHHPTDKILDVGCGTGTLTLMIAETLTEPGSVTGIDAAERMIEIARKKAARRGTLPASFQVGIAEELEFPDASFDMVVNSMFLHHVAAG